MMLNVEKGFEQRERVKAIKIARASTSGNQEIRNVALDGRLTESITY